MKSKLKNFFIWALIIAQILSFVQLMILGGIGVICEFVGVGVMERFFLKCNMTFSLAIYDVIFIITLAVLILSRVALKRLENSK